MVNNDSIKKHDLDLIIEVNKKVIEIHTEVADQNEDIMKTLSDIRDTQMEVNETAVQVKKNLTEKNEEMISSLEDIRKTQIDHDRKIDKLIDKSDETNKDLFRMQVLFITGLLSLVIQVIQIFIRK